MVTPAEDPPSVLTEPLVLRLLRDVSTLRHALEVTAAMIADGDLHEATNYIREVLHGV